MIDLEKVKQGHNTAGGLIERMGTEIAKAIPRHMSGETFARNALTALRQNETLLEAITYPGGKASFLGAMMQAAQLGLELGPLGHCYLIPYAKKRNNVIYEYEITFIIGYKGMIELARRSGNIKSIYANEVCEKDFFDLSFGVCGTLAHKPELREPRGEMYGVYAFADLGDGGHQYLFLRKDEIDRLRDTYSSGRHSTTSPWKTEYVEMAKKTAIRRLFKTLPIAVEVANSVELEGKPLTFDPITATVNITPEVEEPVAPVARRLVPASPRERAAEKVKDEWVPQPESSQVPEEVFAEEHQEAPETTTHGYRIFDVPQKISGSHARRAIGAMVRSMTIFGEDCQLKIRLILLHMNKTDVEAFLEELKAASPTMGDDGQLSPREDVIDAFISRYHPLLPPTATVSEDDE